MVEAAPSLTQELVEKINARASEQYQDWKDNTNIDQKNYVID